MLLGNEIFSVLYPVTEWKIEDVSELLDMLYPTSDTGKYHISMKQTVRAIVDYEILRWLDGMSWSSIYGCHNIRSGKHGTTVTEIHRFGAQTHWQLQIHYHDYEEYRNGKDRCLHALASRQADLDLQFFRVIGMVAVIGVSYLFYRSIEK